MVTSKINLDWSKLLGFDQVARGDAEPASRIGAKVGGKGISNSLGAKVGSKGISTKLGAKVGEKKIGTVLGAKVGSKAGLKS